ncbi:MAG: ABC-type transport auxiliary lipoprotein family protein [Campylobacterales bacterium]|nr:ABC-type transport auxiliary lipoprotein family protein [Campylobacterales bacterium]
MKTIFSTTLIAFILTGCSALRPSLHEYTILPSYVPHVTTTLPIKAALKLSSTRSIPSLVSTQLYYLKDTSHIDAYLYSRWSDSPSSMIDRSLYSSLQNRQLFTTLIPVTSKATADLILESDLNAFYHRFLNDSKSEGLIDITYRLIDLKTKTTLASKRFYITEPALSADAQGGVNALTKATHQLSENTIDWLETVGKENQWIK